MIPIFVMDFTSPDFVAEVMQRHLPGSTFVVRNVPGAGTLIGTNMIYAAKPDGAALEDKEFLARAVKLDLPIEPAHGDDVGKSVTAALA